MIYGIGVDLVKNSRFFSWINDSKKIERFFNEEERLSDSENISDDRKCEYYATRYAAKEAFSKALGTGLRDMKLQDIWVSKDDQGCPFLNVSGNVKEILEKRCGKQYKLYISITHEKEYSLAYVIIERG